MLASYVSVIDIKTAFLAKTLKHNMNFFQNNNVYKETYARKKC